MTAAPVEEKKAKPSAPELFMQGAKKGFYIGVELIVPAMVMAYSLLAFLKYLGIMPVIGQILGPVMSIFGLPGEASLALLAAFLPKRQALLQQRPCMRRVRLQLHRLPSYFLPALPWVRLSAILPGLSWFAACGQYTTLLCF